MKTLKLKGTVSITFTQYPSGHNEHLLMSPQVWCVAGEVVINGTRGYLEDVLAHVRQADEVEFDGQRFAIRDGKRISPDAA